MPYRVYSEENITIEAGSINAGIREDDHHKRLQAVLNFNEKRGMRLVSIGYDSDGVAATVVFQFDERT